MWNTDYRNNGVVIGKDFSMTDVKMLLKRQAAWQKRQAGLPWSEKIRMAANLRAGVEALKQTAQHPKSD